MSQSELIDQGHEDPSLLDRRRRAFRLHKLGQGLELISKDVGVSTVQVWKDIKWCEQHAVDCLRSDAVVALSEAYSELEFFKREALDGWIRSQLPKKTRTRKRVNEKGAKVEREEITAQSVRQAGDPRFLEQAKDCLWRQAVLLGMVEDGKQGRAAGGRAADDDVSIDDMVAIVEVETREQAERVFGRRYCRIATTTIECVERMDNRADNEFEQ
jgi:hypothetical protein